MTEYISREETVKKIEEKLKTDDLMSFAEEVQVDKCREIALSAIKAVKSADAQTVKHGKWCGYLCSECNEYADYFISGNFFFDKKPNFCPNCGADMKDMRNDNCDYEGVNMNDFEKFLVDRTFNEICRDYYTNFQCGSMCPFYNNPFTDQCDCAVATYTQKYEMLKQYFEKFYSNIYKERP